MFSSSSSSVYLQSLCVFFSLSLSLLYYVRSQVSSSLILDDFSVSLKKGHPNYQPAGLFVLRGPAHDVSQCSEVPECKPVRPQAACLYLCRNVRAARPTPFEKILLRKFCTAAFETVHFHRVTEIMFVRSFFKSYWNHFAPLLLLLLLCF